MKAHFKSVNNHVYTFTFLSADHQARWTGRPERRLHLYMVKSDARSSLEHKLAQVIKMRISNESSTDTLYYSRLNSWQPWPNRRENWASSPELSPHLERWKKKHAVWVFEPNFFPLTIVRIPNKSSEQLLQNSCSKLLFNFSFRH